MQSTVRSIPVSYTHLYVARELVKPAGYVTNEEAINFDTKYQGQDVKTAVYNSEYKNTPTNFEFTKKDITSGAEPVSYTHLEVRTPLCTRGDIGV